MNNAEIRLKIWVDFPQVAGFIVAVTLILPFFDQINFIITDSYCLFIEARALA